jgi:hypothetical protein
MRINNLAYNNESHGMAESGRSQLSADSKVARMLINDLAKDKVRYPVREILSNAWDASPDRVTVTLPTWLDPTFHVRDFNPKGSTHDEFVNIFAAIGVSTKEGDNAKLGKWGLGSKSPHAYLKTSGKSGAYNVTCYKDGEARFYLMGLDSEGYPMWSLLGTSPTDEPNGIEVSWGVRKEDFSKFQQAVREIAWFFNPRPTVKNMERPWPENPTVLRSGTGWTEYNRDQVPFWGPHVRIGCVAYPIDLDQLERSDWPWRHQAIVFEAEIGSLEVTISREELAYDDRTVAELKRCVEQMETEFLAGVQEKLDAQTNLPDAIAVLYRDTTLNVGGELRGYLQKQLTFKGHPVTTGGSWNTRRLGKDSFHYSSHVVDRKFDQDGGKKESYSTFSLYSMFFDSTQRPKFVFERLPKFSNLKFREAEKAGLIAENDSLIWLRPKDETVLDEVAQMLRIEVSEMIDLDALMPSLKRRKREATDPIYVNLHVLRPQGGVTEGETVDITQGGRYICRSENKRRNGYSRRNGWEWDLHHFIMSGTSYWTSHMKHFPDIKLPNIALATEAQEKRLKKVGGWTRYTGKELLAAMEASIDFAKVLDSGTVTGIDNGVVHTLDNMNDADQLKLLPADIVDFRNKYHAMKDALASPDQENTRRYNIYRELGGTTDASAVSTYNSETADAYTALKSKYPIFDHMMAGMRSGYTYRKLDDNDVAGVATYLNFFNDKV